MATIKEATLNAIAFAKESLGEERTQGIRLEEVESVDEGGQRVWHITLSMVDNDPLPLAIPVFGGRRLYKTFTVLKDTGEVIAMKIRELSNS